MALGLLLALGLGAFALVKPLDHDEGMYVAAGALLARGAGLPYRDYPFFQMPGLPLLEAPLFLATDHLLLAARLANTALALGALGLLCALIRRPYPGRPWAGLAAGAAAVLLVAGSGPFAYASGLAWNHDLPVLLTLAALALFVRAPAARSGLLLSGLALGLAATARLAFAPALAPFLGAACLLPAGPAGWRQRLRGPAWLLAGAGLGLLPALGLAALALARFLFDNLTYHGWNAAYWQVADPSAPVTLLAKLATVRDLVFGQPAALALLGLYALVALPVLAGILRRGRLAAHWDLALAATLVPCLLAAALVPSPAWYQYFYAPVPFLALAAVRGCQILAASPGVPGRLCGGVATVALALAAGLAALNGGGIYRDYLVAARFPDPAGWVPLQVHTTGAALRAALGPAAAGPAPPTVLTLAPLYPLEGGLALMPAFSSGPFAWRVAPLLPAPAAANAGLVGPATLAAALAGAAPAAILTAAEGALDAPLVAWAQVHAYRPAALPGGLTLWRPSAPP